MTETAAAAPAASVQFYHLLTTPMDRALPRLLEKAYASGFSILLLAADTAQAEHLNQLLWTYDPGSFLPHGSQADDHAGLQPIYISTSTDTPNNPRLLAVLNGQMLENPERYERILDIFDGTDPKAVELARLRWSNYKNKAFSVTYLRQNETGGWDKKSVA
jgi:DNA polymerase III subunit chi